MLFARRTNREGNVQATVIKVRGDVLGVGNGGRSRGFADTAVHIHQKRRCTRYERGAEGSSRTGRIGAVWIGADDVFAWSADPHNL